MSNILIQSPPGNSLRGLRWILPSESAEIDPQAVLKFRLSPPFAALFAARGMDTEEKIRSFIEPQFSDLADPFEIPDLDRAVERLMISKRKGERVCVFSDYDVDGLSGGAQLVETFRHIGLDVFYYVPHRFQEGYGLNVSALKAIREEGARVVVTVDCGISNAEEVEHGKKLGLDLIITDHHSLPAELPDAHARVHPKRIEAEHPSRHLSGSGVAFKLALGLLKHAGQMEDGAVQRILDLAVLGTLADMVPLQGENRILAALGLRQLNLRERPGIRALCEVAKVSGKLTEWHVLFVLGPRLNAAGRLYEARKSLDLLLEKDPARARRLAEEIHAINMERRSVGEEVMDAVEAAILQGGIQAEPILLLAGEGWHPGVVGIVASRIVEQYRRPAVVVSMWEGLGRASVRSIPGIDIYEILQECRDLFVRFGGHAAAAGFTIEISEIPKLRERLHILGRERVEGRLPEPTLTIDAEARLEDISMPLAHEVELLAPFGQENAEPVFWIRDILLREIRQLSGGKHLKLLWRGERYSASLLGFGWGNRYADLSTGDRYDVAFHLRPREWNGFESAEARLVDLRPVSSA